MTESERHNRLINFRRSIRIWSQCLRHQTDPAGRPYCLRIIRRLKRWKYELQIGRRQCSN